VASPRPGWWCRAGQSRRRWRCSRRLNNSRPTTTPTTSRVLRQRFCSERQRAPYDSARKRSHSVSPSFSQARLETLRQRQHAQPINNEYQDYFDGHDENRLAGSPAGRLACHMEELGPVQSPPVEIPPRLPQPLNARSRLGQGHPVLRRSCTWDRLRHSEVVTCGRLRRMMLPPTTTVGRAASRAGSRCAVGKEINRPHSEYKAQ